MLGFLAGHFARAEFLAGKFVKTEWGMLLPSMGTDLGKRLR